MIGPWIHCKEAAAFVRELPDGSVRLLLTDPPYYGIVDEPWDNQWKTQEEFVGWLTGIFLLALPKLTADGSLIFFGGLGKHGCHPLFGLVRGLENGGYAYRNWITWKKRRAYGKSHDYLYTREEILWFSRSSSRTEVVFHKPYTSELRGYEGFDPRYKALSDYKRVGNVFTDIEDPGTVVDDVTELFRPGRYCQKPGKLIARLVETHTDPGDLVVDPFAGWGTTVIESLKLGRRALGSEIIPKDAGEADLRARRVTPLLPGLVARPAGNHREEEDK